MGNTSFAELISTTKVMVTGLQANAAAVAARGLSAEFITALGTAATNAEALNGEQEALKAALKTKTAELDAQVLEIKNQLSEATKVVKLAMDKSRWVEFGITAKR
ncbi:MAG: hypothetical protein ABIA75_13055 [Candidatus Neomarinimicrobiota bacterium]